MNKNEQNEQKNCGSNVTIGWVASGSVRICSRPLTERRKPLEVNERASLFILSKKGKGGQRGEAWRSRNKMPMGRESTGAN